MAAFAFVSTTMYSARLNRGSARDATRAGRTLRAPRASRARFGSFDGVLGKTLNLDSVQEQEKSVSRSSLDQQLSQTKTWLKEKLAHREYKMIFSRRNPAVQKRLDVFVVTLKALCKFLKTLAR